MGIIENMSALLYNLGMGKGFLNITKSCKTIKEFFKNAKLLHCRNKLKVDQ